MCDRFILHADLDDLSERYGVSKVLSYYSHQNSRLPHESVAAITQKGSKRTLDEFRWGLMPFWARDSVQADSDNVFRNRAFDYLVKRQRCIIPGSSFDRVTRLDPKNENSERYIVQNGQTFAMAGVYDVWNSSFGEELRTCTIIIKKSTNDSTGADERIPVILDEQQIDTWLDPNVFHKNELMEWMQSIELPPLRLLPASYGDRANDVEEENSGALTAQPRIAKP